MTSHVTITKWTPTTDLRELRRLGKLAEELGELQAVVARCIIQGVDEIDPSSSKVNRIRLGEEIADVIAQIDLTRYHYVMNKRFIEQRVAIKKQQMAEWEELSS